MAETLLEVERLIVDYGGIRAVREASITVGVGEVVCILGRNGAGKSSLVRAIAGVERPAGGRVLLDGQDLTRATSARRSREGIALVPEERRIIGPLTVRENLQLAGPGNGALRERRYDEVLDLFAPLRACTGRLGRDLSGGQQQMLAIARALMSSPRLLILDEPSLGLAPIIVADVYAAIRQISDQGQSVLLIEQNAEIALDLASRAYLMNHGEVVQSGASVEFSDLDALYASYL